MRQLDTETLDGAALYFARQWLSPSVRNKKDTRWIAGRDLVLQDLFNVRYKDEFEYLKPRIMDCMGGKPLAQFEKAAKETFTPRDDKVFADLLKQDLAITPDGEHIPGCRGTVQIGSRRVGTGTRIVRTRRFGEIMLPKPLWWPVYAGEEEERKRGSDVVDPLPEGADPWPVTILEATNPTISAAAALAAADAVVDLLDGGSTAATIRGRSGTQPADPDDTESGTLLFTLTMSEPAFGSAADDSPGGKATADTITDDSSADATGTLGYCRVGSTGDGAEDVIDGSVGTSDADFVFNTVSIVAGTTVSMSSFTFTVPQGSTAS